MLITSSAKKDDEVTIVNICSVSLFPAQMSWNGSEQLERAMEEVLDDVGDAPGPPDGAGVREVAAAPSSQIRPPSLTLDTSLHGII